MPSHRRILVSALAAGSLVLAGAWGVAQASPSAYGSGSVITSLPARAMLLGNQTPAQAVTVTLPVPTGLACATDMTTRTVGQRNAVTVSPVDCSVTGSASWTVAANPIGHKRHAVVKFIATNPTDGSRKVSTLGVKVNPGARPAKPSAKPTPSASPKPSHGKPNRPAQSTASPSASVSSSESASASASGSASTSTDD